MDFRPATIDDCALINEIASRIWEPTYSHLMSPEQLEYMFEMMYAPANLLKAMTEGGQRFLIFSGDDGSPVGYVSYETLADHEFYLQKIYLLPGLQGRGSGRLMLETLFDHLRALDPAARRIGLNVNRQNLRAVWFYLRNGFEITARRDHPIGNGYFMYDYILHREL